MSNWPVLRSTARDAVGLVRASSRGTQVANISGSHTWTAYTQIVASTAYAMEAFLLQISTAAQSGGRQVVLEIAVGASGSEQTLFGPISLEPFSNLSYDGPALFVPMAVAAGQRLSMRVRSDGSSFTGLYAPRVTIHPIASHPLFPRGLSCCTSVGLTISGSATTPTSADGGGTANTLGAWTELTASTTRSADAVFLCLGVPSSGGGRNQYILEMGIGAAGSEVTRCVAACVGETAGQITPRMVGPFPMHIPAGSRLAIRCQSSSNASPARIIGGWALLLG